MGGATCLDCDCACLRSVKCSNYIHSYAPPAELWTFMTGSSEGHPPFLGAGAHVGTHQAKSFYTPALAFQTECSVDVGPSSRMGFCWNWGTPFWERKLVAEPLDYAVLLWSTTRIRGMVAVNPRVPVTPWLEPKDSVTYPPGGSYLAHSDMYLLWRMVFLTADQFCIDIPYCSEINDASN